MVSKSLSKIEISGQHRPNTEEGARPGHKAFCGREGSEAEAQTERYLDPHCSNEHRNFIAVV